MDPNRQHPGQHRIRQVPGRHRPQLGQRHPPADLDVHRRREPELDPARLSGHLPDRIPLMRHGPVDLLLDRVWADRPPLRARNALSGYVSRIRRLFAGTDELTLIRHAGAYRLSVNLMAVDLHRFRHLIGRARAATADEEVDSLYEQALGLWD